MKCSSLPVCGPALLRLCLLGSLVAAPASAAVDDAAVAAATRAVAPAVIAWRRDFHQHPELGNREVRTAGIVAEELRKLGLEVRTGVAHTGVVGTLRGARPGPTIALRADMDALPVTEQTDLPFKSVATSEYRGEKVGVMHACGHDAHVAILLGVAKALAGLRAELPGTVLFVFQPAEEGPPEGERGGAELMLDEGLFAAGKPAAMLGLHVWSALAAGQVGVRAGSQMAGADTFRIVVSGRQTHGALPWGGVDPIVTASQIVLALQTIVSRQVDLTQYPAIVSVGAIRGGIRNNIIPEQVELIGTFRTFDAAIRQNVIERIKRTATATAAAAGATAAVEIGPAPVPPLINDEALTARLVPAIERAVGRDNVVPMPFVTPAEDFAIFRREVPIFYFFVGVTPPGQDPRTAPRNHSPLFFMDEAALAVGVRALTGATVELLQGGK
jgi:amidohydrolase